MIWLFPYQGGWLQSNNTVGILHENMMKDFWLSWSDEHIQLGQGMRIGENILVEKKEESDWFEVNALSFSAMLGINLKWEFPADEAGK